MSSFVHRSAISIEEIICVVVAMNGFGCPGCTTKSIVSLEGCGNQFHEQRCPILCTVCFYHILFFSFKFFSKYVRIRSAGRIEASRLENKIF